MRSFPAVDEVIAVGIPVESEEEVMVVIVPKAGQTIEPQALIEWLTPRLPYFAVPRFVDFVDRLPTTENGKVQKFKLCERGVTATTWDREAAGYKLARPGRA